jgi:paraquat-inducible protein A
MLSKQAPSSVAESAAITRSQPHQPVPLPASSPETAAELLACPECDLLQTTQPLAAYASARCVRCKAFLYRHTPHSLERALIACMCSVSFFFLANFFPLISLELQQTRNSTSLLGAVFFLLDQGLGTVALLLFVCMLLVPMIEICALLYILLPLRFGRLVPGLARVFRLVLAVRPWSMVEVFMLGILVSGIRVSSFATVETGIAAWSLAGLMLSLTASAWFFNERDLWRCVQAHQAQT